MTVAQGVKPIPLAIDRARLRVVALTIVLNIVVVAALVLVPDSDWRTGLALNLVDNLLLIGFAIRHRDRLMAHLLLFGLIAGVVELVADAWLVPSTGTLDYAYGGGPQLWRSPLWMPLAWEVVAVQFGYLGMRLVDRFGLLGYLLIALLGAVNIPYYEEMALRIHWWRYRDCRMFLHTPYYIIVGEFLIAAAIAAAAFQTRRLRLTRTVVGGVLAGASILAGYWVGYGVTEHW
ncbi:MAG: hypothetical protein H0W83_13585 [Planctomycetes bacterium]|nr:hypothetical protein [Planctomycetota bacterium]